MRMDTDQLIRSLTADNDQRGRTVRSVLITALVIAAPVSVVMFFTTLGFRKDISTALQNPFFDVKFSGDDHTSDLGDRDQHSSVAPGSLAQRLEVVASGPLGIARLRDWK
jgi:hypothetical protein